MKKTLIVIAVLMVGVSSVFAQKAAKTLGPVTVSSTDLVTYAMQNNYVVAVSNTAGVITFTLTKAGKTAAKNKADTTKVSGGFLDLNNAGTWTGTDVANIAVIGFKGKSIVVRYTFNDGTIRLYGYTLAGKGKAAKLAGSTSNMTAATYGGASSDGKNTWLVVGDKLRQYAKQLDGTKAKPKSPKTTYTVTGAAVLPVAQVNKYSYDVDSTGADDVITLIK